MSFRSDTVWTFSRIPRVGRRLSLSLLCAVGFVLSVALDPFLLQVLIDKALPSRDAEISVIITLALGVLFIARSTLYEVNSSLALSMAQSCGRSLASEVTKKMMRLQPLYHEQVSTGAKLTYLLLDIDAVAMLGTSTPVEALRALLYFVSSIIMMARLDFITTLMLAPLFPLFFFVQRSFSSTLTAEAEQVRSLLGARNSTLEEHIASVPQLQFLGAQHRGARRCINAWHRVARTLLRERRAQIKLRMSSGAILAVAGCLVLGIGSIRVQHGFLSVGGLVAFYTYVIRTFEPMRSTLDIYSKRQSISASIRHIQNLLEQDESGHRGEDTSYAASNNPRITVDNVSLAYGDRVVLENFELVIEPGERLAVCGTSGSGKTSFAKLLVRAAGNHSGCVQIDGIHASSLSATSLRKLICYLPQTPAFFDGTIKENLLYGRTTATLAELDAVVAAAQLGSLLESLPLGFDTPVGPGARLLSGGERQRLAIARALLRQSPVLVLDEATSAIDETSERLIFQALRAWPRRMTLIVISHRVSSLAWTDRRLLIKERRIQVVTQDELLSWAAREHHTSLI